MDDLRKLQSVLNRSYQQIEKTGGIPHNEFWKQVHVEIRKAQLAPEQFRRVHDGRDEFDPLRLDGAVEDRPRARVGSNAKTELEFHGCDVY